MPSMTIKTAFLNFLSNVFNVEIAHKGNRYLVASVNVDSGKTCLLKKEGEEYKTVASIDTNNVSFLSLRIDSRY